MVNSFSELPSCFKYKNHTEKRAYLWSESINKDNPFI